MSKKEIIIISLGGSLVVPGEVDVEFLKKFKSLIDKHKNKKFFIIVGGGKTARIYQKALKEIGASASDMDWIGIRTTWLNAEVIKNLFKKDVYSEIVMDPNKSVKTNKRIIVGAGWKPGCSTDKDAVLIAKTNKIKIIINLSNTDYVYDKDPGKFSDARKIEKISWQDFQKIVGTKWIPGLSMPFDPIASKLASKLKMKVVMINGKNLDNLNKFLNGEPFIGTKIE